MLHGTTRRTPSSGQLTPLLLFACLAMTASRYSLVEAEEGCQICRYQQDQSAAFGIDLPGNGRRYAPVRLVDVLHIKLDVTPNFDRHIISGTTRLDFKPIAKPTDMLELDAIDLQIAAVRSSHKVREFDNTGQQLIVYFEQAIAVGEDAWVEVDHAAEPTRGFYFRTPKNGYPAGDMQGWTQGEAHEARFWFPCFDYPNERSTTEVICHVPEAMTVLSNGQLLGETAEGNGMKAVHWRQDKPHVNYLICLVAGYFEKLAASHRDVPLGFYSQPSLAQHASNSFADTAKIMAFLEAEIGVPFPWDKYDQVTILDFVAGGMENTTLTTLTERTIFTRETENIHSSHQLDAHEMTHQWFGDLVTCKDWSHLWLNEGFATYYTHLYDGHKFGEAETLYGLYQDAVGSVLPRHADQRPIVYNGYGNAGEQFDFRAYPKGSWVLHMLRCQLGPDLFRRGVKQYLGQHAFQSVVTDDLRQALEAVSGQPLDRFFDQWVYHAGNPQLKISYSWDGKSKLAHVNVKQTQATGDNVLVFELPTKLRFHVGDQTIDHAIRITEQEHDFYVPLPAKPDLVRFDPNLTLLAEVDFNKPDEMLFRQLQQQDDAIGRVLAAVRLADRKNQETVKQLQQALQSDTFYGVRIEAAKALGKIDTDEAYAALKESRQQDDARVRQQVVRELAREYRPDTLALLLEIIETEANPAIQAVAIRELGRFSEPDASRTIRRFLKSDSFRNELADAAVAAADRQLDPANLKPLMATLESRSDEFTSRGLANVLRTTGRLARDRKQQEAVGELLRTYLHHPKDSVKIGAVQGLGELRDRSATALLQSLAANQADGNRLAEVAKSALTKLQDESSSPPAEVAEMRKQLTELKQQNDNFRKELDTLKAKFNANESAETPSAESTDSPSN